MTSNSKSPKPKDTIIHNDTETRVRRALGLEITSSSQNPSRQSDRSGERFVTGRPKSRFIRDGEVPVVMIRRDNEQHVSIPRRPTCGSPTSRLEVAEKAVKTERHARETAERSLAEAQVAIHDLQTKLGHAVLVSDEARVIAQRYKTEKIACELALAVEQTARRAAELRLFDISPAPNVTEAVKMKSKAKRPKTVELFANATKNVGTRRTLAELEPQPVKWWLKSKRTPGRLAKA